MKIEPYVPPANITAEISIADELTISSPSWPQPRRVLAAAAMLLMAQMILTNDPFEAHALDNSYEINFSDRVLMAPPVVAAAIEAVSQVLGGIVKALHEEVISLVAQNTEESQPDSTSERI